MSYITAIVGFLCLIIGWEVCTWHYEAGQEKAAVVAEKKAAAGEVKIIHDTQTIVKVITHEKSAPCLNEHLPADLLKQLH